MLYRDKLEKKIREAIKQDPNKRKTKIEYQEKLYDSFGIPEDVSSDYLSYRKDFDECDEFVLYAITKVICGTEVLKKHFSGKEINHFDKKKFEIKKLEFPFVFKMIQIRDNQWIGKITVRQLIEISNAQLIHYNENTQRTLQRVYSGGIEYYRIALNKSAVEEIRKSYDRGSYIPNTLTFNLPEGTEFDYNERTCEFSIINMEYMDIIDGYHRYIAAIKESNLNPYFDYEMEIRFVCFSEEDAKKFIFQEDQKTKMSKIDSESFNQDDYGNKITNMVNSNSKCMLAGKISTGSEQIINAPELSRVLNEVYIPKGKLVTSQIITISTEIVNAINTIVSEDLKLLDNRWSFSFIVSALFCTKQKKIDINTINKLQKSIEDSEDNLLYNKHVKKGNLEKIEELYKSI